MSLILAYQNRGITKDLTILDGAGARITPGTNDKIRVVIGRVGKLGSEPTLGDAELVVTSDAATANGSSFTKNHPSSGVNRLRLDASDLTFKAGTYTLFVDYYDVADSEEWKQVSRQVFVLMDT